MEAPAIQLLHCRAYAVLALPDDVLELPTHAAQRNLRVNRVAGLSEQLYYIQDTYGRHGALASPARRLETKRKDVCNAAVQQGLGSPVRRIFVFSEEGVWSTGGHLFLLYCLVHTLVLVMHQLS